MRANSCGDAMVECERLLRAAGELSAESKEIKETLSAAVEAMQSHLLTLPGVAKQEAQRVRDLVRVETEEILDLSARTLSTIHARTVARNTGKLPVAADVPAEEPESEGLLGLARRFTQRGKRKDDSKSWEMSTLLAAAETNEAKVRGVNPEAAAALAALQAVLADLAIDLDAIAVDEASSEDQWRRYLSGDRSVFARRLASALDAEPSTASRSSIATTRASGTRRTSISANSSRFWRWREKAMAADCLPRPSSAPTRAKSI